MSGNTNTNPTPPKSYSWVPPPDPEGSLAKSTTKYRFGIEKNFNAVQGAVRQIIQYAVDLATRVLNLERTRAPIESPVFTGKLGLPVLTTDPGDPPVGVAWIFVLSVPTVSADQITRFNDGGTILESIVPLT